jgi:hypothetical protein
VWYTEVGHINYPFICENHIKLGSTAFSNHSKYVKCMKNMQTIGYVDQGLYVLVY